MEYGHLQGVILGRLLAGQDRQIEILQRIEWLLSTHYHLRPPQQPPAPKPSVSYIELMSNIRSTAFALLPIAVLALIIAGKITLVEGWGIIRQMLGMGAS